MTTRLMTVALVSLAVMSWHSAWAQEEAPGKQIPEGQINAQQAQLANLLYGKKYLDPYMVNFLKNMSDMDYDYEGDAFITDANPTRLCISNLRYNISDYETNILGPFVTLRLDEALPSIMGLEDGFYWSELSNIQRNNNQVSFWYSPYNQTPGTIWLSSADEAAQVEQGMRYLAENCKGLW
ncbi:hypothetical protein [Pseudidiomarina mangrovi]|uniref:hypothetical protein n=1 Tax=Pseudidiomarina mangrovi TaxID=2487133 RepID=UPI000FCA06DA|nr:hypothetical protein [Pseudidiomarina mangrovi]